MRLIKVGALFILFLPLIMNSQFFFPFIVVKNVLFRLAVEIIFGAYVILATLNHLYRPKFSKLVWAVVIFYFLSLVSTIFGINVYTSFWGNYERMSGLFHHLHLVLYFFVLFNVFRSRKDWNSLFTFSIFASVLMTFFAFSQWLQVPFLMKSAGGTRLSGTVGNATFFAAYLLFNLFFIFYFWAKEKRFDLKLFSFSFLVFDIYLVITGILSKLFSQADWSFFNFFKAPLLNLALSAFKESFNGPQASILGPTKIFIISFFLFQILIFATWFLRSYRHTIRTLLTVTFIFEFFIFFNTQTRGAIIGLIVSIGFLSLVSLFLNKSKNIRRLSWSILLVIILLPFILFAAKGLPLVKEISTLDRLASISTTDTTTESRLLTWEASWRGWTESAKSFLIGYGPENYYYAFNKYFPTKIFKDAGSRIWFDRAHDLIFDVGVTTGILGLFSYLSILTLAIFGLVIVYKKSRSFSSTWLFIGLIIAYFVQNIFVFDTLNTEILLYLLLAFVVYLVANSNKIHEEEGTPAGNISLFYSTTAVVLILVFAGVFINIKTLKANHYIFQALVSKDGVEESYEFFEKSIEQAVTGKFEARQQFANFAVSAAANTNIPDSLRVEILDAALTQLQRSIEEESLNVRHYIWLGSFYNQIAQLNPTYADEVINLIKSAIPLSPSRPQLYFELGQAYLFKNQPDQAIESYDIGVGLAPWVIDSHVTMIYLATVTGRDDILQREFEVLGQLKWVPTVSFYDRLVNFNQRIQNYSRAIEFQLKVIELEPNQPAYYFDLAKLYALVDDKANATQAAQKVLELDPTVQSKVQEFLDLLNRGELKAQ